MLLFVDDQKEKEKSRLRAAEKDLGKRFDVWWKWQADDSIKIGGKFSSILNRSG